MHSKFLSRLRGASWTTIVIGVLVCGYLFLSAASTQIVTDRQGELARIAAITNIAELKARASGLAMIGNNSSEISMGLLWIAMLASLFFAVLAGFSLHWLGRLERVINEKSPHA
jgi:hypothetical protein